MALNEGSSSLAADGLFVDTLTLINLCRKHNSQILPILTQLGLKDDIAELMRTTQRIQQILTRCVNEYGDLKDVQLKTVEVVYVAICKYEKKINQLQKKGKLARFITQAHLRGKIDKLSNSICVQVEGLEREMRDVMVKQLVVDNIGEFNVLLSEIDAADNQRRPPELLRRSSGLLRNSFEQVSKIKDKETREKVDNELSIVRDPQRRNKILAPIPSFKVKPLINEDELVTVVSSHNDSSEKTFSDYTSARSISTYPMTQEGKREGDPICDMFASTHFETRTLAAVADGCSWGEEPKEAARKASRMFLAFMKKQQHLIRTTDEAAFMILRAFLAAHKAIIEGRNEETLFIAGTTTMLAGIILELEQPQQGKPFIFVAGSIGDCKGYHYSAKLDKFQEMTRGNRGSKDVRDPGGRLGPTLEAGAPDLRNLTLFSWLCDENDIIILVSDGVHDNLDPKIRGKTPLECGFQAEEDKWENLPEELDDNLYQLVESFIDGLIPRPVTVASITRALMDHCYQITDAMRTFIEQNPGKKVPTDYIAYPGKLDHATSLSFKVGRKRSWMKARKASETKLPDDSNFAAAPHSQAAVPRNSQEFTELLQLDYPSVLQGGSYSNEDNNSYVAEFEEAKNDSSRLVWDSLFGGETYVVEWNDFINGLKLPMTKEEQQQLNTIIDYSKTGSVTRYKFQEFLKGFGPLECCIENVKRVVAAEWFHGFISANESKKFLEQQAVGTYLIRFSGSRPGSFVLDFVREPGHVRSVRLNGHPNGGFAAPIEGGTTKERVFKSLQEIVDTYAKMGVLSLPFSSSLPQKPWFFGDLTREEAEKFLKNQPPGTFLIRFSNQPGCFAASFIGNNGAVLNGLITLNSNQGYRVNNQGMIFQTLDDLVLHYQEQKIFTVPYRE